MAPPSTPVQPRFLLSKRQAPQSQKQAPTTLHSGPLQFASTPRFNVAATPRSNSHQAPPFSTPAPPSARLRVAPYESLSDAIDTSPIPSDVSGDAELDHYPLDESIEVESPSASGSPSGQDERPSKRRRLSLSPEIDPGPESDVPDDPTAMIDEQMDIQSTLSLDDRGPVRSPVDCQEPMTDSEPSSPAEPVTRNPTFQNAPRFKTTETGEATQQRQLPDAFSPQRRGAKYVPGGLATEVRNWLVQLKGACEYDRPAGLSVQVTVDEVKSGAAMWLIAAHRPDASTEDENIPARAILAGDGRITGLGGRSIVNKGDTVSMSQPMWDVTLHGLGQFAVACDWENQYETS